MKFDYKASFNSIQIAKDFKKDFKDLLNITITNMGTAPVTLNVKGVDRVLYPVDSNGRPTSDFRIDCYGIPFDETIEILFSKDSSKVVIDYSTLIQCNLK